MRRVYKRGLEDAERVVDEHKKKESKMKHDPKDPDLDEENNDGNDDAT